MITYNFHWRQVFNNLPELLLGAATTIEIAALSMVVGIVIAVFLAVAKTSKINALKIPANLWIEVARNTPALFQIYMIYFGLGTIGLRVDSFTALLVGIAFNNAGYLAETFRGGFAAIPETQTRAGRSLGMSQAMTMRLILLPQMFRIVFLPITNQMVWAILMTSLGVIVGLSTDLTGVTQDLNVKTFRTFEYFMVAAVLYYGVAKLFTVSARLIAWRLFKY